MDRIVRTDRLPANLGVEIEPAGREPATLQQLMEAERHLRYVHRELVSVPAQKVIAAIDVERPEDAKCIGKRDLVLERMAGENRVVLFEVELDFLGQAIALQEPVAGRNVENHIGA